MTMIIPLLLACSMGMVHSAAGASLCLPNAIPESSRTMITVNGIQMPLSVWQLNWATGILVGRIFRILSAEVLGYNTTDTVGGSVFQGLLALAGCANVKGAVQGGERCDDNSLEGPHYHIMLEGWASGVEWAEATFEQNKLRRTKPIRLNPIGYNSGEGIYVSARVKDAALYNHGDALDFYRAYNATWHDPARHFDSFAQISSNRLKMCNETRLGSSEWAITYVKATGDVAGIEQRADGTSLSRCWHDNWWFSPSCRSNSSSCLPLITGGDGWGLEFITQQVAVHEMPVAIATGKLYSDWNGIATSYRTLFYWWSPDETLQSIRPSPIAFPRHDRSQWSKGLFGTEFKSQPLHTYHSVKLKSVAIRAYSLLESFRINQKDLEAMFVDANGTDFEGAACRWLRKNEPVWKPWIAGVTTCSPGQGMVNANGNYVSNRSLATTCRFCSAGYRSVEVWDKGVTYACEGCPPGKSQAMPGASECVDCKPGKAASTPASASCSDCPEGQFSNASGLKNCSLCDAGRHQGRVGSSSCMPCSQGTATAQRGQAACARCDEHSIAPSEGSRYCESCIWEGDSWVKLVADDTRSGCEVDKGLYWTWLPGTILLILAITDIVCALDFKPGRGWAIRGCCFHILDVSLATSGHVTVEFSESHNLRGTVKQNKTGRGSQNTAASITGLRKGIFSRLASYLFRGKLHIYFCDTGHYLLDDKSPNPKPKFIAEVIGNRHLKLYHRQWHTPVTERIDTSMGIAYLPALEMLLHSGRPFPVAVQAFLLLVFSVLLSWYIGVTRLGVCMQIPVSIGAALAIRAGLKASRGETWLETSLQQYSAMLKARNPSPVATKPGPTRAFRAENLIEFFEFFVSVIKDRSMYYLDTNILRPICAPYQLSFSEVVGPVHVQWFVSHFWGTPFAYTVKSLKKHADSVASKDWGDVTYWVCTLSNNQFDLLNELGGPDNWQSSSFYITLRSGLCKGTCMVLTEEALPLTRSWCLFELLQTMEMLEDARFAGFGGLLFCTDTGVLNEGAASVEVSLGIGGRLADLRLQDASASHQSDKDMIDGLVMSEMGGFDTMNAKLRSYIGAAIDSAQKRCNADFETLNDRLESSGIRMRPDDFEVHDEVNEGDHHVAGVEIDEL
eukprot:TRINITY_DN22607_c0_g1_i1.p1 TRINITY_DN22607_c0_g1~~TRINITY_DN22607_c0_g1_i1.p1  ORF type:complete len:1129 (-),score=162.52 TRINITY_DN22607_c0_g1_i1:633-4019(-)